MKRIQQFLTRIAFGLFCQVKEWDFEVTTILGAILLTLVGVMPVVIILTDHNVFGQSYDHAIASCFDGWHIGIIVLILGICLFCHGCIKAIAEEAIRQQESAQIDAIVGRDQIDVMLAAVPCKGVTGAVLVLYHGKQLSIEHLELCQQPR